MAAYGPFGARRVMRREKALQEMDTACMDALQQVCNIDSPAPLQLLGLHRIGDMCRILFLRLLFPGLNFHT